jgi:hypothetical protein
MARKTTTKPQAAPAEATGENLPTFAFKAFKWAPDIFDFPRNATVHAWELSNLVNHVKDVANGAATVFQLMLAHEQEIDRDNATYLNPCDIGVLQQLAIRALKQLDVEADDVASRLHDLAREKT